MTALSRFARLLGLPAHQAEDALHSERAARAVLSRRSFFVASGAMVAGTAFSFAPAARLVGYRAILMASAGLTARTSAILYAPAGEHIYPGSLVTMRDGLLYAAKPVPSSGWRLTHMITYVGVAA